MSVDREEEYSLGLTPEDEALINEALVNPQFMGIDNCKSEVAQQTPVATPTRAGLPFALALPDFMAGPTNVEWLINELIPSPSLTILAAKPKMGKSIFTFNLAICLRKGESFLGRTVKPTNTLILQLEDPPVLIRNRLERMGATGLDGIYIRAGIPMGKDDWTSLKAFILDNKIGLTIIDPLAFAIRGNEQEASHMAPFFRQMRELIFDTNCSIILVHHHRKSGGENGDAIRGSSAILGAVDVALELHRDSEQAKTATLKVTSRFASVEDEVIVLDTESLTWKSEGSADDFKRTKRENEILRALESEGECDNKTLSEVLDLDPKNFRKELKDLVFRGWVNERKQSTSGRPRYYYSLAVEYFSAQAINTSPKTSRAPEQEQQDRMTLFGENRKPKIEVNAEKPSNDVDSDTSALSIEEVAELFNAEIIPDGVPF